MSGRAAGSRSVTTRALTLLSAFDEAHPRLTLSELSRRSGLPLSTAHRLLAELEAHHAVERDGDGSYTVGRWIWQLGTLAPVQRELRAVAFAPMQDVYQATHENVHLAVLAANRALYIERIHGSTSVSVATRPGRPLPLHATGVGKVLLAYAPDEVVRTCLEHLNPVTPYTIVAPERMRRELAAVRRAGYARTVEEMTLGTSAIAVPIFGTDDEVVAALGLVTRSLRRDLVRFVPALRVASATITRELLRPGSTFAAPSAHRKGRVGA